jgi:hypothetical protein
MIERLAMKNKIRSLLIIITVLLSAASSYASDIKDKTLFTPCQYKGAYKYYMERAKGFISDEQYESAIESFERALIIQPNSQEARAGIIMARESLSGKKQVSTSLGRTAAMHAAVSRAEDTSGVFGDVPMRRPSSRAMLKPQKPVTKKEPALGQRPSPGYEQSYAQSSKEYPSLRRQKGPSIPEPGLEYPSVILSSKSQTPVRSHAPAVSRAEDTSGVFGDVPMRRPSSRAMLKPQKPVTKKEPALGQRPSPGYEQSYAQSSKEYPSLRRQKGPSIPEPGLEPGLKYPSAILSSKSQTPSISYVPTENLSRSFGCSIPVFQEFSDGFNSKIQDGAGNINSNIAPSVMKGEYRIAFGATNDDFIWKDANADYHNMPGDTSWRYLYGKDRHNSYDKAVYSRLKVDVDAYLTDTLSGFGQMVIDPWTFVGKKRVYITGTNGDHVQIDYKYWSNTRSTINEIYRTDKGDIVSINENKVKDGKTSPVGYTGLYDWGPNTFNVPEVDIDRMYVPIRKLWIEYNRQPYHAKVFAMAGQEEALTSDDPMRLSNNKIWWEESPWLDSYEESRLFIPDAPFPENVKKGQWVRNLSFVARDSDDSRLTFLRGASFDANLQNGTSLKMTVATPRNLWDTYEQASSIPAAVELRSPVTDRLTLGGLYTFKGGVHKQSLEAMNNLGSIDGTYQIFDNTEVFGQFAASNMRVDEAGGYKNDYNGYAGSLGIKNQGPISMTGGAGDRYEFEAMFTSMNERFFPGLSNYRFTSKEFEFAKHIYFDDLNPENEACMFGDGMDVGRNAFRLSAKAEFPEPMVDTRFDFRTVYSDGNDHIEDAYRLEGTYKPVERLTLKGLAFYKHLPKTTAGIDPLINASNSYSAFTDYFSYEDIWLKNDSIAGGKDPSIGAFSAGLRYDFTDYFTGEGIYESTNDPKDYPRGLLNNVYASDYYKDGIYWDQIVPFLYSQDSFGVPPYDYYSIFKARFIYYPFEPLKITLRYTYNENKYAMAIDDNPTAQGLEVEYKPCPRMTLGFLYQYTRQRDLYKQIVANEGYNFDGHHNIFAAFDYQINQDQHLRLMYGAYVGYDYGYAEERDDLNALDTRHIIRFSYTGKFGPSDKQSDAALTDSRFNALGPLNPAIPGAAFTARISGGWARYKEEADIAPVESDWDNYILRLDLGMDAYDREYWEGGLRLGLFTTLTDQEEWRYAAGTYQRNDMSLRGADINADIGWAISNSSKYISVTPLLHAGYRRVEFSRSKISISSTIVPQLGEVDENFNISYAGIGARVDIGPVNNLNFHTSGYWAPLVYAPINNSRLGRVTCDRGTILHAEGGVDYAVSDRFGLNLGGFWDKQHLKKASRIDEGIVALEMPDNKLETFGLTLGGQYRF